MAASGSIKWQDRKHFMWFPFSFTKYQLGNDRIYSQKGLLNTKYDEVLLYRVVDITLQRSLAQKIFGTGTIILSCRADTESEVRLINIKNPIQVKNMLSDDIEMSRNSRRVVGKEFWGGSSHYADSDYPDPDGSFDSQGEGFDFDDQR